MSAEPSLRLVGCAECERLRAENEKVRKQRDALTVDLENAHVDLTVKRRRITQLENELAKERRLDPMHATAFQIFEFWSKHCHPQAHTFSADREKAVLARLNDKKPGTKEPAYSPRYICEAILGAKHDAYVDPKGKRHDDLELICRSGRKLEDFHGRYERWKAKR